MRRFSILTCAVGFGAATVAYQSSAKAFCRTTTCDETEEVCLYDDAGCPLTGNAVYWPDLCVSFDVHAAGSTLRGISSEKAAAALRKAFQTWISADCGGGRHPSLGAFSHGEVYCDKVEYNYDTIDSDGEKHVAGPNANIMVFRDENWDYEGPAQTLAVTTITFTTGTGQILDADIELNSFGTEFTTGEDIVRTDLQAVLTHEVGHFLGLAHSRVPGATMNSDYDSGNLDFRSLSEDDRQAICTVYPPLEPVDEDGDGKEDPIDCKGQEPRFGFSRYCGEAALADGCTFHALTQAQGLGWAAALLVTTAGGLLRRRRPRG